MLIENLKVMYEFTKTIFLQGGPCPPGHPLDPLLLESIIEGDDKAKAVEANGFFLQIHTIKLIFLLVVFMRILSCTKRLSDQLQCKDIDMAKAVELVFGTMEILNEFRDN